jgi:PAS domain-containing protein
MAKVRTPPRTVTQRRQTTSTPARRHPRSSTSALFVPALLAHAFELVQIIDATGLIRYVSPAITRVLGYQPEEVQGKESASFVHSDDLPRLREAMADLLRQPGGSSAQG